MAPKNLNSRDWQVRLKPNLAAQRHLGRSIRILTLHPPQTITLRGIFRVKGVVAIGSSHRYIMSAKDNYVSQYFSRFNHLHNDTRRETVSPVDTWVLGVP